MTYVIDSTDIPDADVAGLTWHVQLEPDEFQTEPEGDGYTARQVDAFKRDEWSYVVVVVAPVVNGLELDQFRQVLGSVEYGRLTLTTDEDVVTGTLDVDLDAMINGTGDGYEAYPVPDMIGEARAEMAAKLPGVADSLSTLAKAIARADAKRR